MKTKTLKKLSILAMAIITILALLIPITVQAFSNGQLMLTRTPYNHDFDETDPYPFNERTGLLSHFLFDIHNGNEKLVTYCVEYQVHANSRTEYQKSNNYPKHTEEQKRLINLALLFGFNDKTDIAKYPYTDDETMARLATQGLVWTISHNYYNKAEETQIVNKLFAECPQAKSIYQKIKLDISDWDKIPNFMKSKIELQYNEEKQLYEWSSNYIGGWSSLGTIGTYDFTVDNERIKLDYDTNSIKLTASEPVEHFALSLTRKVAENSAYLLNGNIDYYLNGDNLQSQVTVDYTKDVLQKDIKTTGRTVAVGNVTVHKQAEALTGFEEQEDNSHQPVYNDKSLANTVYELYNANTQKCVDILVTDEYGQATSKNLNLGNYFLLEADCPEGIQIDNEPIYFTLSEDEQKQVINEMLETHDERQKAKVQLFKTAEEETTQEQEPLSYVKFGLYNRHDILDIEENILLEADSLIEVFGVDIETGEADITTDLPLFETFYIKEIETAIGYVLDDTEYEFSLENEEDLDLLEIFINEGKPIHNRLLRGSLNVIKTDDNGERLNNATFALFDDNGDLVHQFNIQDDGAYSIDWLTYGKYVLKEIEAPLGYEICEDVFEFEILEDEQEEFITVVNNRIVSLPPEELPQTSDNTDIIAVLLGLVTASSILYIYHKKSKNDKE